VNLNCRQVSEEQSDGDACIKHPNKGTPIGCATER
jgi:hypothetical protein